MKMRSLLLGAVAGLCITAFGTSSADAQIYTAFTNTITNKPYTPLVNRTILSADRFRVGQTPGTTDRDNGYYYDVNEGSYGVSFAALGIPGFTFEYDGRRYDRVNINVNGFVSFGSTLFLGSDQPENLFRKDPPNAVVAPYWGDHYYRTIDDINFLPSEISAYAETVTDELTGDPIDVVTIQWKDLNINFNFDPANPTDPLSPNKTAQRSSVGTFQVKLYRSAAINMPKRGKQGDIEFHYSTVGNPQVAGVVKTSGAAVGIESHAPAASAGQTTFMNGLFIEDPTYSGRTSSDVPDSVRMSTRLSATWAPSRANNNVIVFRATPQPGIGGWGDGDANLSQLSKHLGMPQRLFVTTSDVISIMRAVAQNRPLDSLRFRGAYHGDVNHNGRYYFSTRNADNTADVPRHRVTIETRSENEFDNLPADNSLTDIYFESNEYDAALIMAYMAGKVPTLPWLIDTVVEYGKAGIVEKADGLVSPVASTNGKGLYTIPLYLNGSLNGPLGMAFDVNGQVQSVGLVNKEGNDLVAEYNDGRIVIVGKGNFAANELLAYVVVSTQEEELELSDLRFNDVKKGSVKIQMAEVSGGSASAFNYPNPIVSETKIHVAFPTEGHYTVAIYDMLGNKVRTVSNTTEAAGEKVFVWDGTDELGNLVGSGMYIYRIDGADVHIAKQMTVVR